MMKRCILLSLVLSVLLLTLASCRSYEVDETVDLNQSTSKQEVIIVSSEPEVEEQEEIEEVEPIPSEPEPFYYLTDEERTTVEQMVMGECGYEPYEGQLMVAYCVLNACLKEDMRPAEIRVYYQYGGWMKEVNDSVKQAVSEIFDDGYRPIDDTPLWFYAPKYVTKTPWHETQRYICTIGGHKFFGELE